MATPESNLLIIGDSITLGVAELRGNEIAGYVRPSYVDLLREDLDGVHIETDADVHRTTTAARGLIEGLLDRYSPDVVLLMLGGNDADLDWKRFVLSDGKITRSRVDVTRYADSLRQMATDLIARGVRPVLTDMPNHCFAVRGPYVSKLANKDITAMLERGGGQAESDRHLVEYRAAASRVAEELNVPIVEYGDRLHHLPPIEMVGVDGVHPSAAAHRIIAEELRAVLEQVCRRPVVARTSPVA